MSAPPRALGPYQVLGSLGAGGMGEVWLAYDPQLDRRVAIKRVRPEASLDDERRARFQREARLAAALNHAAIVKVHHLLTAGVADHIVMEYVPGSSLRQRLREHGPMQLDEGLSIAATLAEGLAYAHHQGVVHRDLKTENVILTPDNEPKITDFGIARRLTSEADATRDAPLTHAGSLLGTYRAMSPEHICGDPVDERSDLFSFGVLLYEIFTGDSPFLAATNQETMQRVLRHLPPRIDELTTGIPPAVADLVAQLLEKDPLMRPRDAGEVAGRLRALADHSRSAREATLEGPTPTGLTPTTPASTVGTAASSPAAASRGKRLAITLAVAALLAIGWLLSRLDAGDSEPLYVAVMEPVLEDHDAGEAAGLLAFAIRNALVRALLSLEEVSPKAVAEVDATRGPPAAVARVVAADEALVSSVTCRLRNCWVQLSRVRASDDAILWSGQTEVPLHEPLLAARSTSLLAMHDAYAAKTTRAGMSSELRVEPADYKAYLELRRIADTEAEDMTDPSLLARVTALRERSEHFPDAYLLEAEIALRQFHGTNDEARLEHAFTIIDEAQRRFPGNPAVLLSRVHCETIAGRLDAAEETLEELEELVPGDVEILQMRAQVLNERGEPRRALAVYRSAIDRRPSAALLINYARLAYRQGEVEEAADALAEHLRLVPDSRRGRRLLGTIELTNGDLGRAVTVFEELVAQSALAIDYVLLGLGHLLRGDPGRAAGAFQEAVTQSPNHPGYLLNLADARWLQGHEDDARALYHQILEMLDHHDGEARPRELTVRAQVLAHLGRHREAVADVQEALRKAPGDRDAAYEAALVYALVGDHTAALVNAEKAIRLGLRIDWFHLSWFDDLRSDPAFQELTSGTGSKPRR